jgi:subtilase family serine protease
MRMIRYGLQPQPIRAALMRRSRRWAWLAATTLVASVAAYLTATAGPAAAARPARASTASPVQHLSCGPAHYLIPCYSPAQFEVAYGVTPLLSSGINGSGETVVLPELANPPGPNFTDIRQDLAAFDSTFSLPAATLKVTTTFAGASAPYVAGTEEVEDTEMVHAIAPGATLDVVLVPNDASSSPANFAAAVTDVVQSGTAQGAAVISISASGGEHYFTPIEVARLHAALQQAAARHVTVVASSGDSGAISDNGPPVEVSLPASDPLVLSVGGTALNASFKTGQYFGEMAWNQDTDASGGGYSILFRRPSYQDGIPGLGAMRGVPDVAADADSTTAMALAFTGGVLIPAQGTSAATPMWAGVVALADQEAGQHLGLVNPAIYRIARSPACHSAFHDVVTGGNSVFGTTGIYTGYQAGPGWDPVTGWGSPNAQVLVPLLAQSAGHPATGSS